MPLDSLIQELAGIPDSTQPKCALALRFHRHRYRAVHAHAVRLVVDAGLGLDLPGQHKIQQPRTEALPLRWGHRWPAAFHPIKIECAARSLDGYAPGDVDLAAMNRQRAVLRDISGEFVHRHAERYSKLG